MNHWSKYELRMLRGYNYLLNDYAATPDVVKDSFSEIRILTLEAKLLISNKPVIGYLDSKGPMGVYTFNEALKKENYYISQGKVFTYHPVGFNSMNEFIKFENQ